MRRRYWIAAVAEWALLCIWSLLMAWVCGNGWSKGSAPPYRMVAHRKESRKTNPEQHPSIGFEATHKASLKMQFRKLEDDVKELVESQNQQLPESGITSLRCTVRNRSVVAARYP